MTSEKRILGTALKKREYWNRLQELLDKKQLSEPSKLIYDEISKYYELDPLAQECDKDSLEERLARTNPKHKEILLATFHSLEEVSPENLFYDLSELKRYEIGQKLAAALLAGNKNEQVKELITLYNEITPEALAAKSSTSLYEGIDLNALLVKYTREGRIKFMPRMLNEVLGGGVLRKNHVVIFGRPEIGKSTFLKELTAGFLWQKLKVLYVTNEDPAEVHQMRMLVRLTKMSEEEIEANPEQAQAIAGDRNIEKFMMLEVDSGTLDQIEEVVVEKSPDILIVDQIRNLNIKENNYVLQLEKAARGIRILAKRYDLVGISVTQAGDSAEGKEILGMGDIDYSNTGIPGSCDLLMGFGGFSGENDYGFRTVSFPKNKISGVKTPIRFKINTEMARLEE
jgi:KaiC/GvpD/RAD55 family RecA-like ATPase